MKWSHHEPVRLRFGEGCLGELPAYAPEGRLLLVTTPGSTKRGVTQEVEGLLEGRDVVVFDQVAPNPTLRAVQSAADSFREAPIEGIVAVGGGSVLDTAKALGMMLAPGNGGLTLKDHFADNRPFPRQRPLPLLAVPTTAGTGSEVTPFGTLWDDEAKRKMSIKSPYLHAAAAIVDPRLTLGLPRGVTLSSGLDALSHAMESVWNLHATPVTLLYAKRAVGLILEHLPRVLKEPGSMEVRSGMMEGSLLAGLAIATTRTALAHSISYPLTAHHGLTHGLACSFTLPALLRFNEQADDGRLLALAHSVGSKDVEDLARRLERLYLESGAASEVARVVPDERTLLGHVDEMFDPERAGNNMRRPDKQAVLGILGSSAKTLFKT